MIDDGARDGRRARVRREASWCGRAPCRDLVGEKEGEVKPCCTQASIQNKIKLLLPLLFVSGSRTEQQKSYFDRGRDDGTSHIPGRRSLGLLLRLVTTVM
jgi:hypothetical protein